MKLSFKLVSLDTMQITSKIVQTEGANNFQITIVLKTKTVDMKFPWHKKINIIKIIQGVLMVYGLLGREYIIQLPQH